MSDSMYISQQAKHIRVNFNYDKLLVTCSIYLNNGGFARIKRPVIPNN